MGTCAELVSAAVPFFHSIAIARRQERAASGAKLVRQICGSNPSHELDVRSCGQLSLYCGVLAAMGMQLLVVVEGGHVRISLLPYRMQPHDAFADLRHLKTPTFCQIRKLWDGEAAAPCRMRLLGIASLASVIVFGERRINKRRLTRFWIQKCLYAEIHVRRKLITEATSNNKPFRINNKRSLSGRKRRPCEGLKGHDVSCIA